MISLLLDDALERSGLSHAQLVEQWARASEPTASQLFGERAALDGVEAILYPSSIDRTRSNAVVFPDNLSAGSSIAVVGDESPTK